MIQLFSLTLFIIFLFLACIHIYWLLDGKWATHAVIPTKNIDEKAVMPGPIPTLTVALGLLAFGITALLQIKQVSNDDPVLLALIRNYGLWIIIAIFSIRAIGDFRYIGFFKKIKHTTFGRNDSMYFSPLCLIISLIALVIEIIK